MKRWFKYAAPYKKFFILGPLCMIVEVIGEALMPKLMSTVINSYDVGLLTVERSIITALLMILLAVMMLLGGVGGAYSGSSQGHSQQHINEILELGDVVCQSGNE